MDFRPGHAAAARAARCRKSKELEAARCELAGDPLLRGAAAGTSGHRGHRRGYLPRAPPIEELRARGGGFAPAEGQAQIAKDAD